MTVTIPDLAPGAPSRLVLVDAVEVDEAVPTDGYIDFGLDGDLRVPADGRIITRSTRRVTLADGKGQIRLPVASGAVADDAGDSWYIRVKKSWLDYAYAIRVPAGSGSVSLAHLAPVEELTAREAQWALRNASITVREGAAAGSVSLANGTLHLDLTVPRGLPGPGAVTTDTAVAALVETASQSQNALDSRFQRGYTPGAFGVSGDGTTDDTAAWNSFLAAVPAGAIIVSEPGARYKLTGPVTVPKSVTLDGGTWLPHETGPCLSITGDDVTLSKLRFEAPSTSAVNSTQRIIHVQGTQESPVKGLRVRDVTMWGGYYASIWLDWAQDFHITDCDIQDQQYAGIMVMSSRAGVIRGNTVRNVKMGGTFTNAYGIALSDNTNDYAGACDGIVVDSNIVSDVPGWEGIDTHSGRNLRITNNVVTGCRTGIAVLAGNSARLIAPTQNVITGNQVVRGDAPDDKAGIQVLGVSGGPLTSGIVADNVVYGYTRDLLVTSQDRQRLVLGAIATDAPQRLTPTAPQYREYNVLTAITAEGGAGTVTRSLPAGWFTQPPLVQVTKMSAQGAKFIPYVGAVTTESVVIGLYDPTQTQGGTTTVQIAMRATQANSANAGGTPGT